MNIYAAQAQWILIRGADSFANPPRTRPCSDVDDALEGDSDDTIEGASEEGGRGRLTPPVLDDFARLGSCPSGAIEPPLPPGLVADGGSEAQHINSPTLVADIAIANPEPSPLLAAAGFRDDNTRVSLGGTLAALAPSAAAAAASAPPHAAPTDGGLVRRVSEEIVPVGPPSGFLSTLKSGIKRMTAQVAPIMTLGSGGGPSTRLKKSEPGSPSQETMAHGAPSDFAAGSDNDSDASMVDDDEAVSSVGNADDEDEDTCPVCLDEPSNLQLLKCNHALCMGCAKDLCTRLSLTPALCPYCRTVIAGFKLKLPLKA